MQLGLLLSQGCRLTAGILAADQYPEIDAA